jgi:hypothetical protein
VDVPDVSYARSGNVSIASQVVGEGRPDLVAGSGIGLEDRGLRELKGVPGEWRLYAVNSA